MPAKPSLVFFICLVPLLFFPQWHLLALGPFLVVSLYRYTRIRALWCAFGAGLLFDLLSTSTSFGTTPCIYCLATAMLFTQQYNFFEDKLSTLPLMTFFYGFLATFLSALCHPGLNFSFASFTTDLIAMPLLDGLFALVAVSLPFTLTQKIRKLYRYAHLRKSDRG